MTNRYQHMLEPLKIGENIIKNRLMATQGVWLHFIQGPENYPSDALIQRYADVAKNGAGIVICRMALGELDRNTQIKAADLQRGTRWSNTNPAVENYLCQIADVIHFYNSKALVNIQKIEPAGYNISDVTPELVVSFKGKYMLPPARAMTVEQIHTMNANVVEIVKRYQKLGYDGCNLYASYRSSILSCALSPAVNHRTDEYGGCLENRARVILELCRDIKKACGQRFMVCLQISGEEEAGGFTLDDTIRLCSLGEGLIDILHLKSWDASCAHPTGFNSSKEEPDTLRMAQALKESGTKVVIAPNGGYQDPALIDQWIAEGKMDMANMCRPFICDDEYLEKIYEGRGEDIVPCARCNKCHVIHLDGPWLSYCTVNPRVGLNNRLQRMIKAPDGVKNVAVIGGGPAGMSCAVELRKRGHKVTLFEKSAVLGGQLRHTDFAAFKWPLRDFKNYLVTQLYKQGVKVLLNTEPTQKEIAEGGFDAVVAATGAEPRLLPIPGADSPEVWAPIDVFGRERELGHSVVIVGGSETGVETGLYLADCGHNVTVLTRQDKLAPEATPIHYYEMLEDYINARDSFKSILKASTTAVTGNSVTYTDTDGLSRTIDCDSVVVSGGVVSRHDSALAYSGLCNKFFMAGDCLAPGNVHDCNRTAFAAASQI